MGNKYTAEIGAKDAGYTSTMKQINKSTESIGGTMKSVSSSVNASFASMVKAGAAMAVGFGAVKLAINAVKGVVNEFGDAINLGGQLNDLASRTGETAGNLLILQRSFDNAGSSAEKVGPTINKLQKFMDDAGQGTKLNIETLQRLGLTYDELKGKTPTDQMEIFAKRITAIQDPTERAGLAMKVFGKSGGELLPMLQNFSGEIETARSQLGELPNVMDRSNVAFDTISDNLSVIKTKLRDFAAGFLDRLAPAIEFATTMLTRFDAAAAGMKLGDIIRGAGNGISAFTDALKAVSLGDFESAWKIAFTAIKLAAAEAVNSIYANIKGLFAAIGVMLEQSGLVATLDALVSGIANKITSALRGAIADFLDAIGKVSAAEEMRLFSEADATRAENYFQMVKAGFASLGENAADALDPMAEAYDKARDSAGQLINTSGMQAQLDRERSALQEKIAEAKEQEAISTDKVVKKQHEAATIQEKISAINANIVDLEKAIVQAKQDGNKQREVELGKQKAYYEELKRSLELGLSETDAIKNATKARADYVKDLAASEKEVTAELQKQLSLSEDMLGTIERMKQEKAIDPKGRLQNEFAEAQAEGNIRQMERISRQIKGREEEVNLQEEFKKATGEEDRAARTSVQDMAKELGIDTFGKDSKKLREDVKAELEKRKNEEVEKAKKEAPATPKEAKQEQQQEKLGGVVGEILGVCKEISGKLPQHALGY
jgi:hypothetical protein